jgi:hypothetical protein
MGFKMRAASRSARRAFFLPIGLGPSAWSNSPIRIARSSRLLTHHQWVSAQNAYAHRDLALSAWGCVVQVSFEL